MVSGKKLAVFVVILFLALSLNFSLQVHVSGAAISSSRYSSVVFKDVTIKPFEGNNIYSYSSPPPVPEFPPYLILLLFMMATFLTAFVLKRKRNVRTYRASLP
jgi:hypothetical protein